MWEGERVIPKRKIIALQAYLRKQEKSEINNLILHLKELGKNKTSKAKSGEQEENNKDQSGHFKKSKKPI